MATTKFQFARRKQRVRTKLKKSGHVRLSVFRSGQHIYAQLINDADGKTVAAASTLDKEVKAAVKNGATTEGAKAVGSLIAKRGKEAKIERVVFDRGGYLFHGRIKALAEAARAGGLTF